MSFKDANADIQELDRFRLSLVAYADALMNETSRMITAMNQVNQTWDDKIHHKFMEDFEQNLSNIARMRDIVNDHSIYVKGKIDILREYAQSSY